MFKQIKIAIFVIFIVFSLQTVILADPSSTVTTQELQKMMAQEGEPAFTEDEVKTFAKEIIPLVEAAAGRKFASPPIIKVTDREEMTRILSEEMSFQSPKVNSDKSFWVSSSYAACLLGKYGFLDKTLYLMPKNLTPIMQLLKVDPKYTQSLVKLIIAHELTHALQDQEIDLQRMPKDNLEAMQAFDATIEGHATFIADRIGKQLGLNDAVLEMSRLVSAGAVTLDDPAFELINKVYSTYYEQIYLGGEKFIAYYFNQGGNDRVWDILANPPLKTAMIAKPETYTIVLTPPLNYAQLLDGLEKDFGNKKWETKNVELGTIMIQAGYANMDPKDRGEIVADIEHVQSFVASTNDPYALAGVSLFVFKDDKNIPNHLVILEKMAQATIDKYNDSPQYEVDNYVFEDFKAAKSDRARRISFVLGQKNGLGGMKFAVIRICRGNVMLEFLTVNFQVKDSKIVAIAQKIFARYDAFKKS